MKSYDVLIIGGSHAGLSAAMALGRLRRSVLVVDAGVPRNAVADHAHNIAGLDGANPDDLRAQARKDLEKYETIDFKVNEVVRVEKEAGLFKAKIKSGEVISVRKVILSYGVKDKLPAIENIEKYWGDSVFHCPFCHGHEFRDQIVGVVGNAHYLEHMIPMMMNLTKKIVIFSQGKIDFEESFLEKLNSKGIKVYESKIAKLGSLVSLKEATLEDGISVAVDGLVVAPIPPIQMNSTISDELGCERDDDGFVKVDPIGQTTIEGVFAAGDITTRFQSVVQALASGQKAGAASVMELSKEDF